MVSEKIINAVLNNCTQGQLHSVCMEVANHLGSVSWDDKLVIHFIEMLCDNNSIVKLKDINLDYVKKNWSTFLYKSEEYNYRDIKLDSVDNIDCVVKVTYEYISKTNEDSDTLWSNSYITISYLDHPEILKH